ncbi:hypothetical protein LS73_002205 [Helicobacter muridarum]|nr:hypothetical protein [Helicobacter muridarum]TLE01110.1 hypothetical protein LS73_002205 [Helicobacter muridarum]
MIRLFILFCISFVSLNADSFLNEKNHSYQKSKNRGSLIFMTSNVIPLDSSFVKNTPYGLVIEIPQSALNPDRSSAIMSRGMYNGENYTIFRSNNHTITSYRYSRNNSNLYDRIAPNVYKVTHIGGAFYKIDPMPKNLSLCSLVISRSFEAQRNFNPEILVDLNEIPNDGIASILLECPKPNERLNIEGYGEY